MLIIRPSQVQAFETHQAKDFEDALLARIAARYPSEFAHLTSPGAHALMKRSIAAAIRYGLERQGHIAVFVELTVEFGEAFERSPYQSRILELLRHPTLPGEAKLQGVYAILKESTGGRTLRVIRD